MGLEAPGTSLAEDLQEFVAGFSFRFLQPEQPLPEGFEHRMWNTKPPVDENWLQEHDTLLMTVKNFLSRSDWRKLPDMAVRQFDVLNTEHPDREQALRDLAPLFSVQRMSTFSIAMIINWLVRRLPEGTAYVNVGVWHGFTLLAGMLSNPDKDILGIDNFSEFGGPRDDFMRVFAKHKSERHHFLDMDYREYFSKRRPLRMGLYYYDAAHHYHDQLESLSLAEPFFSDDCVVIVDDTNWREPRQAVVDFINPRKKRYRLIVDARTACNAHPTYWNGFLIFQRRPGAG